MGHGDMWATSHGDMWATSQKFPKWEKDSNWRLAKDSHKPKESRVGRAISCRKDIAFCTNAGNMIALSKP